MLVSVLCIVMVGLVHAYTPSGLDKAKEAVYSLVPDNVRDEILKILEPENITYTKTTHGDTLELDTIPGVYENITIEVSGLGDKVQYLTNGTVKVTDISPINGSWSYEEDYESEEETTYTASTASVTIVDSTLTPISSDGSGSSQTEYVIYNITLTNGTYGEVFITHIYFYVAPNSTAGDGDDDFNVYISTDNGTTWIMVVDGISGEDSEGWQSIWNLNITSYVYNTTSFLLKLEFISDGADDVSAFPDVCIDHLELDGYAKDYPIDGKVYIHNIKLDNITRVVEQLIGYGEKVDVNLTNITTYGPVVININVSSHTSPAKYSYTVSVKTFRWELVRGVSLTVDPFDGVQVTAKVKEGEPVPVFAKPELHPARMNVTYYNPNVTYPNETVMKAVVKSEPGNLVHFLICNINPEVTHLAVYIDGKKVAVIPVVGQTAYFAWDQWSVHVVEFKVYSTASLIAAPQKVTIPLSHIILTLVVVSLIVSLIWFGIKKYRGWSV